MNILNSLGWGIVGTISVYTVLVIIVLAMIGHVPEEKPATKEMFNNLFFISSVIGLAIFLITL